MIAKGLRLGRGYCSSSGVAAASATASEIELRNTTFPIDYNPFVLWISFHSFAVSGFCKRDSI